VTVSFGSTGGGHETQPQIFMGACFSRDLSELQSPHLTAKIAAARALIDARVQELLASAHHDKERIALIDALFALHCVEQYRKNRFSSEGSLQRAS
jgi:hypothetical protein